MNLRKVIPEPGMKGWAVGYAGRVLPEGLKDREPVTITAQPDGNSISVVGADGRLHKIFHACVDCGYEFQAVLGRWVHENCEAGRNMTVAHLKELKAEVSQLNDLQRLEAISDWEWKLRRWHRVTAAAVGDSGRVTAATV